MRFEKTLVFPLAVLLLLTMSTGASALTITVSQSGADSDEVMKDRTFVVEATGWTGDCTQATISFSGCSSCSLSGEDTLKTIGSGETTVTWTTVSTSQLASAQDVNVLVSGGCTSQNGDSSSFDIVLPPSLTLSATTSESGVAKGSDFTVNIEISNAGETTANDINVESTTSGFTATCVPISTIEEENSAAESCTVTASASQVSGSKTVTLEATSTNADSTTDALSITVNPKSGDGICDSGETGTSDCEGGDEGGSPGGGAMGGTGARPQNRTKIHALVPGLGLINNTKLQAAMEKVLAKGKLSENARENLLRLSASITADLTMTRSFTYDGRKSIITSKIKNKGSRKATKLMVFETVPKAFAQKASLVTVSAPGAAVEVVEEDPSWLVTLSEFNPGSELIVTYEVSGAKNDSLMDSVSSEIYAESLEETGGPSGEEISCTAGGSRCSGNVLEECNQAGDAWTVKESCVYGCDSASLSCRATPEAGPEEKPTISDIPLFLYAAICIVVIVLIAAGAYYAKMKKKPKLVSAVDAVKKNLTTQQAQ